MLESEGILWYLEETGGSGCIWKRLAVSGGIWRNLVVYGSIWRYLFVSGNIWRYLVVSGGICWYIAASGSIWWYMDCPLYTTEAADDLLCIDGGGPRSNTNITLPTNRNVEISCDT